VWRSPSVGSPGPDFLNAAILVTTNFSQDRLKDILRHLEDTLGRVRVPDKNAPRTIDIDIVVIDGEIVDPSLWNEAFRLIPLSEILPDLYHPQTGKPIRLVAEQYIAITSITQAPLTIKQSPG
jgi:2-amino-4-hydroxy-6-hydroxymethyldihydropteridine diphosphokinase